MASSEMPAMRLLILANAKLMLKSVVPTPNNTTDVRGRPPAGNSPADSAVASSSSSPVSGNNNNTHRAISNRSQTINRAIPTNRTIPELASLDSANIPTPSNTLQTNSVITSPAGGNSAHSLEIVVHGGPDKYIASVMWGLIPAIEGPPSHSPETAMHKLLLASAELLASYIPRIEHHQRAMRGGGVFNEDLVSEEILEAGKRI